MCCLFCVGAVEFRFQLLQGVPGGAFELWIFEQAQRVAGDEIRRGGALLQAVAHVFAFEKIAQQPERRPSALLPFLVHVCPGSLYFFFAGIRIEVGGLFEPCAAMYVLRRQLDGGEHFVQQRAVFAAE